MRVQGSGLRVQGSGLGVLGSESRVQGSGFTSKFRGRQRGVVAINPSPYTLDPRA
jgi:hypothetical protein